MKIRIILAVLATAALAACNTMHGVGRDMTAAGRTVSETATDVQDRM